MLTPCSDIHVCRILLIAALAAGAPAPAAEPAPGPAPVKKAEKAEKARKAARPEGLVERASVELLDIQERSRSVEAEALERRRAAEARLRDLEDEKAALGRTVEALKARVSAAEKDLTAKGEAFAAREKENEKAKSQAAALVDPLETFLRRGLRLVETGAPWKIEARKRSFEKVIASLPSSDPAATLGSIARLQEEEEALARLIEAGAVEVQLPGEAVSVPAFHLGLLAVAYSSSDGAVAGFAGLGKKPEEGLAKGRDALHISQAYRTALDVLRRQSTPRIVDLEVPVLPRESEEGK